MRFPKWLVPVTAALVLSYGCTGSGKDNAAPTPSETTIAADAAPTTEPTPEPADTIDEEPADDGPKEPDATGTTDKDEPAPAKTRSVTPGLPEANLILTKLSCTKPSRIPKLAETNGNDYPKIVFNAMCGSEKAKDRGNYQFGQVGVGEGVTCGTEYVIDGNETTTIAWWCPGKKALITSPAAIIEERPDDQWKLLRELTIAYSFAYTQTKRGSTSDIKLVACIIGRTILNLRVNGMLSTGNANALMDDFTAIIDKAGADAVNLKLRKGYNGATC